MEKRLPTQLTKDQQCVNDLMTGCGYSPERYRQMWVEARVQSVNPGPLTRSTPNAQETTPAPRTREGGHQVAAYKVPASAFKCVGPDGWPLDL